MFQFKSDDENGVSQPIWVLNIAFDEDENEMFFTCIRNTMPLIDYSSLKNQCSYDLWFFGTINRAILKLSQRVTFYLFLALFLRPPSLFDSEYCDNRLRRDFGLAWVTLIFLGI